MTAHNEVLSHILCISTWCSLAVLVFSCSPPIFSKHCSFQIGKQKLTQENDEIYKSIKNFIATKKNLTTLQPKPQNREELIPTLLIISTLLVIIAFIRITCFYKNWYPYFIRNQRDPVPEPEPLWKPSQPSQPP